MFALAYPVCISKLEYTRVLPDNVLLNLSAGHVCTSTRWECKISSCDGHMISKINTHRLVSLFPTLSVARNPSSERRTSMK